MDTCHCHFIQCDFQNIISFALFYMLHNPSKNLKPFNFPVWMFQNGTHLILRILLNLEIYKKNAIKEFSTKVENKTKK